MFHLLIIFFALLLAELFYFRIADRFNIIDKPNERSSHTQITIRGGGIIFPIAWVMYSVLEGFAFPYVSIGMLLMATISFIDDRIELSSKIRLLIHLLSFTLCFVEIGIFAFLPWYAVLAIYIVCIGAVNAINFMDGINGITALYGLSIIIPLHLYFYGITFVLSPFSILAISLLVFGIFNFRKRARCFAGDVGSVSLGYILLFFLLLLIFNQLSIQEDRLVIASEYKGMDIRYLFLLMLYGIDSIFTIVQRLYQKENIFKAHRKHLYQLLVNEYRVPHLWVASSYALIQLAINYAILFLPLSVSATLLVAILLSLLYILLKVALLQKIMKTG